MRRLDEALARLAAHALGGRVRRDEFGMLGFERLQAIHARVVLGVVNLGCVEDVVEVLVVAKVFAQGFDLLGGREAGRHGRNYRERGAGYFVERSFLWSAVFW